MIVTIEKRLYSIKEAAARLNVSRATVDRQIGLGRLRAVKIGAKVLIRVEDLEEYIERLSFTED